MSTLVSIYQERFSFGRLVKINNKSIYEAKDLHTFDSIAIYPNNHQLVIQ